MSTTFTQDEKVRRGAEDSGRYFRYMTEFVGFTSADAEAIRQSGLVIEKYIPEIVADFYAHLLRYPPTRKYFLKKDGSLDQDYLQKRMHHLTNFWRRTASGVYDDEYARYVDYVGRAHTSHGADPSIYIAERYVIGQVGFIQHAISNALSKELHEFDPDLEHRSIRAWNMLMMVILEMLSRAYGREHEAENFEARLQVDQASVRELAIETYEKGLGLTRPRPYKNVMVALVEEIPEGERKIVQVDDLSIGVFHHKGHWYALHNHCLHRGGPVATGCLEDDTLICPWHGFQYNVTNGQLLVDPAVKLEMFALTIQDGKVYLRVPDLALETAEGAESQAPEPAPAAPALQENEFYAAELAPGQVRLVYVAGEGVAVYNLDGKLFATQDACTHAGGPLSEGELEGENIICPWHASCFDVTNGEVRCGPAKQPLKTFQVVVDGEIARVF